MSTELTKGEQQVTELNEKINIKLVGVEAVPVEVVESEESVEELTEVVASEASDEEPSSSVELIVSSEMVEPSDTVASVEPSEAAPSVAPSETEQEQHVDKELLHPGSPERVHIAEDPYLKELEHILPEPPDVYHPMTFACPFDYLVCVDVRCTSESQATMEDKSEVIQLCFVVVQTIEPRMIVHQEQVSIQPVQTSISEYCTRMTGVKREAMDGAIPLDQGLQKLDDFIAKHFTSKNKTFCLVSLSEVDLRTQLARDAASKSIVLQEYYQRMFSMVKEMNKWLSLNQLSGRKVLGKNSLLGISADLGVEMRSRVPSGLEDALTMADCVMKLLEKVAVWTQRPQGVREGTVLPFCVPVNAKEEWELFEQEESRIIYLQGLSYKLTVKDVTEFLAKGGLKAQQLWMIKNSEGRPDGSAFCVFASHLDATQCLALNGRVLLDRPVLTAPATKQVFLEYGHLKAPFSAAPTSKSESQPTRPGDWTCKSCKFHNYAHRRTCMNCHKDNPSHSSVSSHPYKSSTKGAGDWVCGNPSCRFSNYQSRTECMKCKSPRPAGAAAPPGGRARAPHAASGSGAYSNHAAPRGHFDDKSSRARPTDRPGDWTCTNPSCRYHNYASRNECYRCKTPKPPMSGASTPSGYASPGYATSQYGYGASYGPQRPADYRQNGPMREGDWLCPNPSCRYHNYSKRETCALCSMPAPKAIATQSSVYSQSHGTSGYYSQPSYDASQQGYYNSSSYAGYYQQYGQQQQQPYAQAQQYQTTSQQPYSSATAYASQPYTYPSYGSSNYSGYSQQ